MPSLLKPATGGGYVKAGFLGFAGSGKTHTAIDLAIGIRKHFKLAGPLAMYDTESGSDYWSERVKKATGHDLLVVKSRSLADLMTTAHEAQAGCSVLVVDSITHVWRELMAAYLKAKQDNQRNRGWKVSDELKFNDWGRIKNEWAQWPDWFLNSPLHVIVCGRAGWDYDMQEDESGKKSELIKTGIKMKVEGEFGFEPGLVVEMQRDFAVDRKGEITDERKVINRAVVLKDRWGLIDGKTCDDPTFRFFLPHVEKFDSTQHTATDTTVKTEFHLNDEGRDGWEIEKKAREIACEEIKGLLTSWHPGEARDEKKAKVDIIERHLGTRSWTKVESMHSDRLLAALDAMKAERANGMDEAAKMQAEASA